MRVGLLLALAFFLLGCGSDPAPSHATVIFDVHYVQPPPGSSLSIGGYGMFARLTDASEHFAWSGPVRHFDAGEAPPSNQVVDLEPGEYKLAISIVYASDAVVNGQVEYGPTAATCEGRLTVGAGDVIALIVTQVGGESCSVGVAN
ncbi:MAG: hypothetical protein ABI452_01490 [Candidatus Limnocylindrales bacterium]